MVQLSCIIWLSPKSNHIYPSKRAAEGDCTHTEEEEQGDPSRRQRSEWWGHKSGNSDGGRKLEEAENGFSLKPLKGVLPWYFDFNNSLLITGFRHLASKTERITFWRSKPSGDLSQQPWRGNMSPKERRALALSPLLN